MCVGGSDRWVYHQAGSRSRQDSSPWPASPAAPLSAPTARPVGPLCAKLRLAWCDPAAAPQESRRYLPTLAHCNDKIVFSQYYCDNGRWSVEGIGGCLTTPTGLPACLPHARHPIAAPRQRREVSVAGSNVGGATCPAPMGPHPPAARREPTAAIARAAIEAASQRETARPRPSAHRRVLVGACSCMCSARAMASLT
jgi:hypothetical protein